MSKRSNNIQYIKEYLPLDLEEKVIDGEKVLYTRLNPNYDIEISGVGTHLDINKQKYNIVLWDISQGLNHKAKLVRTFNANDLNELKDITLKLLSEYK